MATANDTLLATENVPLGLVSVVAVLEVRNGAVRAPVAPPLPSPPRTRRTSPSQSRRLGRIKGHTSRHREPPQPRLRSPSGRVVPPHRRRRRQSAGLLSPLDSGATGNEVWRSKVQAVLLQKKPGVHAGQGPNLIFYSHELINAPRSAAGHWPPFTSTCQERPHSSLGCLQRRAGSTSRDCHCPREKGRRPFQRPNEVATFRSLRPLKTLS